MKYLKIEIKRVFNSKSFIIVNVISIIIALLFTAFIYGAWDTQNTMIAEIHNSATTEGFDMNPSYEMFTLYSRWIAMDFSSWTSSLFFLLLPIFATLSYGWSYQQDIKSGYIKNIVIRFDKKKYFLAKYFATFCAGALSAAIPLIVSIISISTFLPALTPDPIYDGYYGIDGTSFGGNIFYFAPALYTVGKLLMISIFAGLVAVSSIALTFFINNRFAVIFIPFLLIIAFHYISMNFLNMTFIEFSPLNYLHFTMNKISGWVIFAEYAVLFAVTFFITMHKGNKMEIF